MNKLYARIIGNFAVSFATAALPAFAVLDNGIMALSIGIGAGVLQGLIAGGTELIKFGNSENAKKKTVSKTLTIF